MKTYFTHDNGGRPFKIIINNLDGLNSVSVYQVILNSPGGENDYNMDEPVLHKIYEKIFIGKSKRNKTTIFSGGYGSSFKGNTILFKPQNEDNYIFIGAKIYSFTTIDEIVKYDSTVGNNDVSYPSAMDKSGNIYLLIENVIISNQIQKRNLATIYQYYYSIRKIKHTCIVSDHFPTKEELQDETVDTYCMSFNSNPSDDYDRIVEIDEYPQNKMFLINGYKYLPPGSIRENRDLTNVTFVELTKDMYIQMLENYGLEKGLQPIQNITILCERVW